MNNYEWLLNMGGEERQAWFDAEHADDGLAHENDVSDSRIRKGLGYKDIPPHEPSEATKRLVEELDAEVDSREKLEADIAETIDFWGAAYPDARVRIAIGWLDRQAAITSQEVCERLSEMLYGRFAQKNERIAELEARVDLLPERKCPGYEPENHRCRYHNTDFELTRENVCKLKREVAELQAENEKLKAEVIQYAEDCGECGTAMPKGISWPRWADGSLVELPCKMEYMGKTERLQGIRFYGNGFVLEFTGVDHCKESYGLPYGHVFGYLDDERDEGLA